MDFKELKKQYTELTELRTEFSKTFDKGDGKRTLTASMTPLHYQDDKGSWRETDVTIVDGKIDKNIYKAELLTDQIGYSVVSRRDGNRIDVKLDKIGFTNINYSPPTTVSGNKAVWEDIDKDVDFLIEFRPYRVRCWKRLKSAQAAKEITFTVIEDDTEKELNVVDKIVGSDAGGRPTVLSKAKGEETKLTTEVTKKKVKSYEIKQVFDEKVVIRDEKTRVKSESTEVSYPVMIDADVQVSVGNTADDGNDSYYYYKYSTTITGPTSDLAVSSNINWVIERSITGTTTTIEKYNSFTRFDGITIPQSATIDDATLNLYSAASADPGKMKVYAFDENDPNAPTAPGDLLNKTTGIASNVVEETINNIASGYPQTKGEFDLNPIDVSSIVQELVNSYDYSNEAMLFFYRGNTVTTNWVTIYDYTWGTTKAPELVINYTAAGPSGYGNDVNGVTAANISSINGVATANISKVDGLE